MNTTYFLNVVAGNVFGSKTSPALPTRYYVGVSSTEPAADGTNVTEPGTGLGYVRVEITNLSEPTNGSVTNTSNIDFAESTGDWGTMSYYTIYDSINGGNLLMYGRLSSSRRIEAATVLTIRAGALNLAAVNPAST